MSRRVTIVVVLLCTIVFNVYLVWQLDTFQYKRSHGSRTSSVWIQEDITSLYDIVKSPVSQPSRGLPRADVTSLGRHISNEFCDVEGYLLYIRRLEQNKSGEIPSWARLLTIQTRGYHSFNATVSDRLGNTREILPETRDTECLALNYDVILSGRANVSASVIVIFHNEARSTLMRTIHSVLLRTPEVLLGELILVDDASTFPWLRGALADYVRQIPKTRLLRLRRRSGLIRARLAGAEAALGQVLVFLDAHIEVNAGWLEPLLYRIHQNRKTIAVPQMDVIDWSDFSYWRAAELNYGTFTWDLNFRYRVYPKRLMTSRKNVTEPLATPVMVGCAHAVDKSYFFSSGGYDRDMWIWGGENIEQSFRVWMCGGRVEIVPCSRVGHVFKPKLPYSFLDESQEVIQRNLIRTAEVWMDEYSAFFYATQSSVTPVDMISLAKRKHLRTKMNCKSFSWYLSNVIPDLPVPHNRMTHFGQLSSAWNPELCVHPDAIHGRLGIVKCTQQELRDHFFYIDTSKRLMFREWCIVALRKSATVVLNLAECPGNASVQWHHGTDGHLALTEDNTAACLTISGHNLTADACSRDRNQQQWSFSYRFDFKKDWDLQEVLAERLTPPSGALYFGWLRNAASHLCLSVHDNLEHAMLPCSEQPEFEQIIHLDDDGTLRYRNVCIAAPSNLNATRLDIVAVKCDVIGHMVHTKWQYSAQARELKVKDTGYCLHSRRQTAADEPQKAYLTKCNKNSVEQKWRFRNKL